MNFVRVNNSVIKISSKSVSFDRGGETLISRKWNGIILWKLLKDGIYVRKEYVSAYGLSCD